MRVTSGSRHPCSEAPKSAGTEEGFPSPRLGLEFKGPGSRLPVACTARAPDAGRGEGVGHPSAEKLEGLPGGGGAGATERPRGEPPPAAPSSPEGGALPALGWGGRRSRGAASAVEGSASGRGREPLVRRSGPCTALTES